MFDILFINMILTTQCLQVDNGEAEREVLSYNFIRTLLELY